MRISKKVAEIWLKLFKKIEIYATILDNNVKYNYRKAVTQLSLIHIYTPAAVISNGTLAAQRKCIGTLADIGEKIEEAKLTSPAIIVVGDVVSLNDRLDFFEKRPLFGRKITVPYLSLIHIYN